MLTRFLMSMCDLLITVSILAVKATLSSKRNAILWPFYRFPTLFWALSCCIGHKISPWSEWVKVVTSSIWITVTCSLHSLILINWFFLDLWENDTTLEMIHSKTVSPYSLNIWRLYNKNMFQFSSCCPFAAFHFSGVIVIHTHIGKSTDHLAWLSALCQAEIERQKRERQELIVLKAVTFPLLHFKPPHHLTGVWL